MQASTEGTAALALEGIARRFGRRWVLRGVSLRVAPGTVVALTGRNGSGKTTLLRIIATALRPTRGDGAVFGNDLVRRADAVRPLIGLLGHQAGVYDDLSAAENLAFAMRMRGERADAGRIGSVLEQVALAAERNERVRGFSAGMRRRLALARLLLHPPMLLLLDEPYASFDRDGIDVVNGFVAEVAARGGAVLIATHETARAGGLLDRTIEVVGGRVVDRESGGWPALQTAEGTR